MKTSVLSFLVLMLFSHILLAQKDTLTYKDITLTVHGNDLGTRTILYKNQKFTGVLKSQNEDDSFCYEHIRKGKLIRTTCDRIKRINAKSEKYEFDISKYSIDKAIGLESLLVSKVKVPYDPCATCDSIAYLTNNYTLKNRNYSGYAKKADSLLFVYEGQLKFIKTLYENGSEKEYTALKYNQKNGRYWKKNEKGKVLVEGSFQNNVRNGDWAFYDWEGYDVVVESYMSGKKFGIWHYYIKDNVVRCEYYKRNEELDYYYESTFKNAVETRKNYDNQGKLLFITTYKDGHLDDYQKVAQ